MRAYLILHLVMLVMANWLFRSVTHPTDDDWLTPLLWLGFLVSAGGSAWVLWATLRRSTTFGKRALGFAASWLSFYLVWTWCVVFASQATHGRMIRDHEEPFVLFHATSGMQFDRWDADSHSFFLWATLLSFALSAVLSLCIHFGSRLIRNHVSQKTTA